MKLSHLLFVFICFIGVTSTAQKNNLKSVTYKNISSQISLDKIIKQKKSDYIITKENISSLSGIRHVKGYLYSAKTQSCPIRSTNIVLFSLML